MNQHPYLRAYMAGIVVPTLVLLLAITAFALARYAFDVPLPIERVIIFPLSLVPNLWGLWNIIYIGLLSPERMPVLVFGVAMTAFLVYTHRANLQRMCAGNENRARRLWLLRPR